MIKLLLGRLLPIAAAIGLFASALSPLRPALKAFGVAANALAGEGDAGGAPGLGSGLSFGGGDDEAPNERLASQRRLAEMASKLRGEGPKLKQYDAPSPERPRHRRRRAPRAAPMELRPFSAELPRPKLQLSALE